MKKILAFGASSSKTSINKKLATYAASLIDAETTIIDLNDFEMPLYSVDKQEEIGIPDAAKRFKALVNGTDGIIISFAEHNGTYTTAFKNIFDWASKVEKDMWGNKPMLLLSSSPGARGGATALGIAVERFGFMSGVVVGHMSLPSFYDNFKEGEGITNETFMDTLKIEVQKLQEEL